MNGRISKRIRQYAYFLADEQVPRDINRRPYVVAIATFANIRIIKKIWNSYHSDLIKEMRARLPKEYNYKKVSPLIKRGKNG